MQILFVDESNPAPATPSKRGKKFFTLAGVAVPELNWHSLNRTLNNIKARHNVAGELKWRFFSENNNQHDNPMRNLPKRERDRIREAVISALRTRHHVACIAVVASIHDAFELPYINNDDDLYFYCLKALTERFQYRIQDVNRRFGINRHGIIVIDGRDSAKDALIREMHNRLVTQDRQFTSNHANLIEGLFITASHLSPGVQFADLIAGATNHYFARGYRHWLEQALPAFRRSSSDQIQGYGIVFFPGGEWTINRRRRVGDLSPSAR